MHETLFSSVFSSSGGGKITGRLYLKSRFISFSGVKCLKLIESPDEGGYLIDRVLLHAGGT